MKKIRFDNDAFETYWKKLYKSIKPAKEKIMLSVAVERLAQSERNKTKRVKEYRKKYRQTAKYKAYQKNYHKSKR